MKTRFSVLTVLLAWPTFALAQMPAQAPMKIGIAAGVQRGYDGVKRNYLDAVDKLSDADYAFKPTQDVRSFGQLWPSRARCSAWAVAMLIKLMQATSSSKKPISPSAHRVVLLMVRSP